MQQKEHFKRKLKKRETKIDKYKALNRQLEKDNAELKVKIEDMGEKMQSLRMKMEAKVQEKEFKIIILKN
jgi:predicted RNase H-like nuclease (RuvC/YqgF family)